MNPGESQFLLFTEGRDPEPPCGQGGTWRFLLQPLHGEPLLDVCERELETCGDRLALLAVVRGLEALEGRSRVALLTNSRYVLHGLRRGLPQWREDEWLWEKFGQLVPVRDRDLWQRIDRALAFHTVESRLWRADGAHTGGRGGAVPAPHIRFGRRSDPRRAQTAPGWEANIEENMHEEESGRSIRVVDSRQRRARARRSGPFARGESRLVEATSASGWSWSEFGGRLAGYLGAGSAASASGV